jgi:hypothetical protein
MSLWLSNTSGNKDAVLTMTVVGFAVILIKFLLAGIVLHFGDRSIEFAATDAASIGALLTPTLGAYVARRYTDRKYAQQAQPVPDAKPSEPDPEDKKE